MIPVQTRRGCPMRCSYCSTGAIEGRALRKRSPEKVTAWLTKLAGLGLRHYYFVDNTFNLPPSYAKALCAEIIRTELDIVWRAIVYPVRIDDELVRIMSEAGCKEVSVGFESGSELILHGMNKRFRPEDVRSASETIGKHGIRRTGFLMLGGPGETRESALESLTFADSLGLELMKVTVGIRIYPYTELGGDHGRARNDKSGRRPSHSPILRRAGPEGLAAQHGGTLDERPAQLDQLNVAPEGFRVPIWARSGIPPFPMRSSRP